MAIDEERALVRVTVAAENEIDAVIFQERQEVGAHLGGFSAGVGVVGPARVRRMMPEGMIHSAVVCARSASSQRSMALPAVRALVMESRQMKWTLPWSKEK